MKTDQQRFENCLERLKIPFTIWGSTDVVLEPIARVITGYAGSEVHFEFTKGGEFKHVLITGG